MATHRSSAIPLAVAYAALIVYASLYPFSGWRDPGVSPWAYLGLPWPRWWTAFDLIANLLGYMPLGTLVFGALVRSGQPTRRALVIAPLTGVLLSLVMETLQNYLPRRVSSNIDLALNAAGALLGALAGALAQGAIARWQLLRERWFIAHSAGGLALLVLWPLGLLFPQPVPFGGGQIWPRLREGLADWLQDSAWWSWFEPMLQSDADASALSPLSEFIAIMLGLLAPCLVAYAVSRPGWRRLVLSAGAVATAFGATTLSTALNFGPEHAFAWRTPTTMAAVVTACTIASLLAWTPRRAAAGMAVMALAALVTVIGQAPPDAYFAESLQGWEQGRFIRFHGLSQWVGWLWPYAAMAWLLGRIASRDPD